MVLGQIAILSRTENNMLLDGLKYIISIGKKFGLPLLSKSGAISSEIISQPQSHGFMNVTIKLHYVLPHIVT